MIKFYNTLSKQFSDNEDLVQIFTQLSKDEENHELQFSSILNAISDEDTLSIEFSRSRLFLKKSRYRVKGVL